MISDYHVHRDVYKRQTLTDLLFDTKVVIPITINTPKTINVPTLITIRLTFNLLCLWYIE